MPNSEAAMVPAGPRPEIDPAVTSNVHFQLGYLIGAAENALKQLESGRAELVRRKQPLPWDLDVSIRTLRKAIDQAEGR